MSAALAMKSVEPLFRNYGKSFQEKIFQGLLSDGRWAAQMIEVMHPEFFELRYLVYLTDKYFKYFQKYRCFPTIQLVLEIIKDDLIQGNDVILREQIIEFLHRMRSEPDIGDLQYVKDKALDFCKRQSFKEALEQAVDLIEEDNFESVLGIMKKAVSSGMPSTTGHDFFEDMEARFVKIDRNVVPTGIERLDDKDIFQGGLGRGEIGVVTANTGVGKSHWLVAMGANAMKHGKNVIHYTFELTETATGLRYDSNLCSIPSNMIVDRKEEVVDFYKNTKGLGRLVIKEYPTSTATVHTLRNHIEKLSLKGFIPDLLVIDYADIMRSTRQYDAMRHELKLIYEEVRQLAMELNIPIWTASQANRSSANSDIVGLENMSEAYGKAMVADVVISLSRKASEKSTEMGRLFIAKNRAGRDGLLFPIHINTAMSKFKLLDETLNVQEAMQEKERENMDSIRQKWNEIKKEKFTGGES